MVLNTMVVIAIKNKYSKYTMEKTNIFKIKQMSNKITYLKVFIKNGEITLKVNCPLCNRIHTYKYNLNSFVNKEMLIGGCKVLNTPLFFIGEENAVMKRINKYEQVNGELRMSTIK